MSQISQIGARALAISLLGVFVAVILRQMGVSTSRSVTIVGAIVVFGLGISSVGLLTQELSILSSHAGISDAAKTVMKIMGVGYVFGICSDICSEMGENTVASSLTLVGRIQMLALTFPTVKSAIEQAIELI